MTSPAPDRADTEIRIGVSSCLLGENVRFDGGHKRSPYLTAILGEFVEWVPVCPELELGLGVPRESLRLVAREKDVRLVAPKSGADHTAKMNRFARRRVAALRGEDLDGFVLMKNSPSCGMERVRLYGRGGVPSKNGVGLFARALMDGLPLLPVEEEGRLNDPRLREAFIERVFAYRRLKRLFTGRFSRRALVEFHTREKMLLLAHDPEGYRALGRLVARVKELGAAETRAQYGEGFMRALSRRATVGRHTNVLQHLAGHFKQRVSDDERQELAEVIDDFRRGLVPLIVPVTLLRHHTRLHRVEWLAEQSYLQPHPKELMLRNHV